MTNDPFAFELEDHDKGFIFTPDEVMATVEAAAKEKEIRGVRNDEIDFRAMIMSSNHRAAICYTNRMAGKFLPILIFFQMATRCCRLRHTILYDF